MSDLLSIVAGDTFAGTDKVNAAIDAMNGVGGSVLTEGSVVLASTGPATPTNGALRAAAGVLELYWNGAWGVVGGAVVAPGGPEGAVQFNASGQLAGVAGFAFDPIAHELTVRDGNPAPAAFPPENWGLRAEGQSLGTGVECAVYARRIGNPNQEAAIALYGAARAPGAALVGVYSDVTQATAEIADHLVGLFCRLARNTTGLQMAPLDTGPPLVIPNLAFDDIAQVGVHVQMLGTGYVGAGVGVHVQTVQGTERWGVRVEEAIPNYFGGPIIQGIYETDPGETALGPLQVLFVLGGTPGQLFARWKLADGTSQIGRIA